jgi:hypothetical protein
MECNLGEFLHKQFLKIMEVTKSDFNSKTKSIGYLDTCIITYERQRP